jgi:hypothetical protein
MSGCAGKKSVLVKLQWNCTVQPEYAGTISAVALLKSREMICRIA